MAVIKESWSLEWLAITSYLMSLSRGMSVQQTGESQLTLGLEKYTLTLSVDSQAVRSKVSQLRDLSEEGAQLRRDLRVHLLSDYIDVSQVSLEEMSLVEAALEDINLTVVSSRLENSQLIIEFFFDEFLDELRIPCVDVEAYKECYAKMSASRLLFEGYTFNEEMGAGRMIMANSRSEFLVDFRRNSCSCHEYIDQKSCRHLRFASVYTKNRPLFKGVVGLKRDSRTLMEAF